MNYNKITKLMFPITFIAIGAITLWVVAKAPAIENDLFTSMWFGFLFLSLGSKWFCESVCDD